MAGLEKRFVNGRGHSRGVAQRAVQRLRRLPVVPGWTYLDVGCGNGTAALNKTTHHMPRWRQALGEMERVLRPGGYVIYSDLTCPTWLATRVRAVLGG
jgi:ubiquinone/menaquinone biosynthesis C-methylase UbiE